MESPWPMLYGSKAHWFCMDGWSQSSVDGMCAYSGQALPQGRMDTVHFVCNFPYSVHREVGEFGALERSSLSEAAVEPPEEEEVMMMIGASLGVYALRGVIVCNCMPCWEGSRVMTGKHIRREWIMDVKEACKSVALNCDVVRLPSLQIAAKFRFWAPQYGYSSSSGRAKQIPENKPVMMLPGAMEFGRDLRVGSGVCGSGAACTWYARDIYSIGVIWRGTGVGVGMAFSCRKRPSGHAKANDAKRAMSVRHYVDWRCGRALHEATKHEIRM